MKQDIKNVLGVMAMTLPVFAIMVAGYFHSPMYYSIKIGQAQDEGRYNAIMNAFHPGLNLPKIGIPIECTGNYTLTPYGRFLGVVK